MRNSYFVGGSVRPDSIGGVAVGSVLLALVDTVTSVYLRALRGCIMAYLLLLLLLWFKPGGLFGSRATVRM